MQDEGQLIERAVRAIPSFVGDKGKSGSIVWGIGDDALLFRPKRQSDWIVTTDASIEGVHFLAGKHPPDSVGYKALARAASDAAAMGAVPRLFLLTLALPKHRAGVWLDRVLQGMGRAARELHVRLAGGDTTRADRVMMDITVIGEVARGRALFRAGAGPGDVIYVSGKLGRAQLGLEIVLRGLGKSKQWGEQVRPHLYPRIRVALGQWLANRRVASAMMDLSDGLSSDLGRLCEASGVGAKIHATRVPCVEIPPGLAKRLGRRPEDAEGMALHGGEDYELLFTVPKRLVQELSAAPGARKLRAIGEIERTRGVRIAGGDGKTRILRAMGWDPFGAK